MIYYTNQLYHHGILGQKWGVRRYQNEDGTLTPAGRERYGYKTSIKYKNNSLTLTDNITKNSIVLKGVNKEQSENFKENLYNKGLEQYLKEGNEFCKSLGLKQITMSELLYQISVDEDFKIEAASFIEEYKNKTITEMIEEQLKENKKKSVGKKEIVSKKTNPIPKNAKVGGYIPNKIPRNAKSGPLTKRQEESVNERFKHSTKRGI